jgi:hypothetical protein
MLDERASYLLNQLGQMLEVSEGSRDNALCPISDVCNKHETIKAFLENRKLSVFLMYPYSDPIPDYFVEVVTAVLQKHTTEERILVSKKEAQHGIKLCHICELAHKAHLGLALVNPKNYNVFLEIGMMWGMGKECILLFNKDASDTEIRLPFDATSHMVIRFENREELETELEKVIQKIIIERDFLMNLSHFSKDQIDLKITKTDFTALKEQFIKVIGFLETEGRAIADENYSYFLRSAIGSCPQTNRYELIDILLKRSLTYSSYEVKRRLFPILNELATLGTISESDISRIIDCLTDEYRTTSCFDREHEIISILKDFASSMNGVQANKLASILRNKMSRGYYGYSAANTLKLVLIPHKLVLSEENRALLEVDMKNQHQD